MQRAALIALALTLAFGLGAWRAGGGERARDAAGAQHERGRAIYNYRCYFCHGYSGDAQTVAASTLATRPRDFTAYRPGEMTAARIAKAVRSGLPGTAMTPFAKVLSQEDIAAVAAFVHREFVRDRARNTRYHTKQNGWPEHERYRDAFPFATGALALDQPLSELGAAQARGRRLFLGACVTCHDRPDTVDASHAFALRTRSTRPTPSSTQADDGRGAALFRRSCAYCHAADGSGRNWIGSFLDPPPPDFREPEVAARFSAEHLRRVTRDGIEGTSMPAWRDVLEAGEIEAVVVYLQRAFGRGAALAGRDRAR